MPEHCTCGAKLVEDARFCHRCGRPTREEPPGEEAIEAEQSAQTVAAAPLTATQRLAQLPVSFANPIVLRIAFMLAMMILLVQNIPVVQLLAVVWWLAAGWVAVLWYRRLTGSLLSVRAGARLGSITGVMIFIALTVESAIQILLAGQQLFDQVIQQDPRISELLRQPPVLALTLLITLIFVFAFVVGVCAAGGALGARFILRRTSV